MEQLYCNEDDEESQVQPVVDGVDLWSLQSKAAEVEASGARREIMLALLNILSAQFPLTIMLYEGDELPRTFYSFLYMAYLLGRIDGGKNGN